jgi:hypothetical protein
LETDEIRNELVHLIAFTLTSALGLVEEPKTYGPFRLADTASRLMDLMHRHGLSNEKLDSLRELMNSSRNSIMTDVPKFVATLDSAIEKCLEIVDSIS